MMDLNHADQIPNDERLAAFDQYRRLLFSIAYRMLGSVADAEDMLQEAYIRWQQAPDEEIRSPKAFLITVVSRLCMDHLGSARVRREQSVGQWLPEPLVTDPGDDPLGVLRVDESLSLALLVLLERLTPVERAVFLLREVFDYSYPEIAKSLGQSEANCRQLLHRARQRVGDMRQRFEASSQAHRELLARFLDAARDGEVERLMSLLARDAELHIDGGAAAPMPNVISGADKVARGLTAGSRNLPAGLVMRPATINGDAGVVTYVDGRPYSVLVIDVRNGLVQGVYIVADPDKLKHLPALEDAP
ncbi:MAG TPA: RNA polymerase sigma-70 factor [Candidatus Eremiobacteraceae bacterium]|nr:RNA polymerase sigma-70 factor [Candidatus Eremiobacteraceae bacterium]